MIESGDPTVAVLAERRARVEQSNRYRWLPALMLHGLLLATAYLISGRSEARVRPRQILAVQVVPVQRLGEQVPLRRVAPASRPDTAVAPPEPVKPAALPAPSPPKPAGKPKPAVVAPTPFEAEEKEASTEPSPVAGSAKGLPGGVSASGTTVSGIDDPDFTFGYYLDQLLELIRAQWTRPAVGPGVEVVVRFSIDRDGRVAMIEVTQPSGISSFDLAAQRAVQSASPLPPLPRGYRGSSLGVNLVVR